MDLFLIFFFTHQFNCFFFSRSDFVSDVSLCLFDYILSVLEQQGGNKFLVATRQHEVCICEQQPQCYRIGSGGYGASACGT